MVECRETGHQRQYATEYGPLPRLPSAWLYHQTVDFQDQPWQKKLQVHIYIAVVTVTAHSLK